MKAVTLTFPTDLLARLDRRAAELTLQTGHLMNRSAVARELLERALTPRDPPAPPRK
jgi:hypothetical protein